MDMTLFPNIRFQLFIFFNRHKAARKIRWLQEPIQDSILQESIATPVSLCALPVSSPRFQCQLTLSRSGYKKRTTPCSRHVDLTDDIPALISFEYPIGRIGQGH